MDCRTERIRKVVFGPNYANGHPPVQPAYEIVKEYNKISSDESDVYYFLRRSMATTEKSLNCHEICIIVYLTKCLYISLNSDDKNEKTKLCNKFFRIHGNINLKMR